jgi:dimethylargininase
MFNHAIVRKPCPALVNGLSSASLGKPDFRKALDQHAAYVEALRNCGLEVEVLEADPAFPDSVFVEDVALCLPECAVVTNPGAPSRNGEKAGIKPVLESRFSQVESIAWPGTLDAGDVLMAGTHFFIGLSQRTNREGAAQLSDILESLGKTASTIPLKEVLHLKSGLSYLEQNNLLISGEFVNHPAFRDFHTIRVDPGEAYAANSLWVNSTVLVPSGFPRTLTRIREAGYSTVTLDVSEFRKLDGGLSCLSLRF